MYLNIYHMLIISSYMRYATLRLVRLPIGTNAYTPGLVSFGDSNILMAHLERPDMATTWDQSSSTSADSITCTKIILY